VETVNLNDCVRMLASHSIVSWNQFASWLKSVYSLSENAGSGTSQTSQGR
jgi:hypothetical protein